MKGKVAVGVLGLCGAMGYFAVRGWVAGHPVLPTTFNLEEKGAPEPSVDVGTPGQRKTGLFAARPRSSVPATRVREILAESAVEDMLNRTTAMVVGGKRELGGNREQLLLNGQVLFEGFQLGPARMSESGKITLAAYESGAPALEDAEFSVHFKNGRLEASSSAVWLLQDGKQERISPPGLHAQQPCISPDGNRIAYTARTLDARNLPGAVGLYLYDVPTRRTLEIRFKQQQRAIPLFWEEGNLAVFEGGQEALVNQVTFLKLSL